VTGSAFVWGCARTPFGSLGGALGTVSPLELGITAASGAAEKAGIDPRELGSVVAGVGLPTEPADLALGAALARRLGLQAAAPTLTLLGLDAAAEALAAGIRLAMAQEAGPTLVITADSASRVAYWVPGLRFGASEGGASVIDPLGPAMDPLADSDSPAHLLEAAAEQRGISRLQQDQFTARSHRATGTRNELEIIAPQQLRGGDELEADELSKPDALAEKLDAAPAIPGARGSLTTANTAAPIDGASALVLGAEAKSGARIGAPVRRAANEPGASAAALAGREALVRGAVKPSGLDLVQLGECSAAQALTAITDLGVDRERVNRRGGCLARGRPASGAAITLAVELVPEFQAGGATIGLLADEGPATTGIAALLTAA
jgi:acetyl-CoA C-acetyltransferase